MPISHSAGGTVFTGESINFFALCTRLHAAKLEQRGIRVRKRGPALWKVYRDHCQIPGTGKRRATEQQVIDWLTAKVEELRPLQEHVDGEKQPPSI